MNGIKRFRTFLVYSVYPVKFSIRTFSSIVILYASNITKIIHGK